MYMLLRKTGLIMGAIMIAISSQSQIMIQPQLPSQGLIQQGQLWNILVINNGEALSGCILQVSFQEQGTNRKVFTGTTGPIYVPTGASQLTAGDVGSIQYDYFSSAVNPALSGGLLPIGQYLACYNLLSGPGGKANQTVSQDCLPVTVEPFAPPQLAYPTDKSEVATNYPVFNWLPPMPVNMFTNLRYKIVLTEVAKGQSPEDAIQRNPILFYQDGLKDPAISYPSSYVALQNGKTYAWQVIARNENTYSASTEIWSFNVKNDSFSVVLDNASYPHLQRGVGSNHFIVHEKIKFSYNNEAGDSLVSVRVFEYNDQQKLDLITREIVLQRGLNFIDFDLQDINRMQKDKDYVMEIINGWKENWDLKFRYEPLNQ